MRVSMLLLMAGVLQPFDGVVQLAVVKAQPVIRLSATGRSYFLHGVWDKLILKNVPPGAKIRWKSSDRRVVRIKEHFKNGIWYMVKRDGKAMITAIYNKKRYRCRICVKRDTEDAPVDTMSVTPISVVEEMSDSEVTPSPESTVGVAEAATPIEPTDLPMPVDTPDALSVIYTIVSTPSASPDPYQQIYDRKIADFNTRYISEEMSDYEKVEAVCRFISDEFDYGKEANWFMMVVKGYGDCMASRIGVNRLCSGLGIASYICRDIADHGETMVRISDEIYMTVTGYGGTKPRQYRIYPMSEDELEVKLRRYPSCRRVLGME